MWIMSGKSCEKESFIKQRFSGLWAYTVGSSCAIEKQNQKNLHSLLRSLYISTKAAIFTGNSVSV